MTKRKILVRIALVATLGALALLAPDWLTREEVALQNDFFQYWSAGRYVLAGQNPYDHAAFTSFQASLGWKAEKPILTWNPPWTIGLFLPFALIRYAPAMWLWFLVQGALIAASAIVLWRHLSGGRRGETPVVVMALLFPPSLLSLGFGQLSGWLCAGVALAMLGVARRDGRLVGAALVLLSLKPHFTLLLILGLFAWGLANDLKRTVVTGVGGLALLLAAPLAARPRLPLDYLTTVASSQPREFVSDTLGAGLRLIGGWEHFWIQFVPLAAGVVWLGVQGARSARGRPLPPDAVPLLALVSALAAPYGWVFDNVTAIPALVMAWTWLRGPDLAVERRRFVAGFCLFLAVLIGLHAWLWDPMQWVHGWVPACLLAVYLHYRRQDRSSRPQASHVAEAARF
jgi:hypothetical protein